jgi:hypothetical protein
MAGAARTTETKERTGTKDGAGDDDEDLDGDDDEDLDGNEDEEELDDREGVEEPRGGADRDTARDEAWQERAEVETTLDASGWAQSERNRRTRWPKPNRCGTRPCPQSALTEVA